jgi:hypothetical protein
MLLVGILAGTLAYCAPFAIQISQYDKTRTEVSDSSLMFEDIMLDYFFEAGYVVSNSPSNITADPEDAPVTQAINDAREGSLDYVASVVLVYDRHITTSDNPQLAFTYAAWRLYRVSDGRMLSTGKIQSADYFKNDAETTMRNCARSLSRDLDTELRKF